jgi:hypothetical protein
MEVTTEHYQGIRAKNFYGRYITNYELENFLGRFSDQFTVDGQGLSVEMRPIYNIKMGHGKKKVLMWSQMHGNETTTTKAVMDLLSFLVSGHKLATKILGDCTISIVPILNPDGAAAYTRVNANQVDLNRDARDRSQPESTFIRGLYDNFKPDYCFNLHDQRTIFNVGQTASPATVSFLAPAADEDRTETLSRKMSMRIIIRMNTLLQTMIPGCVGRYDDSFNANCIGDTFQMLGTPTVLVEAGHAPGDYQREITRKYIFFAILEALTAISEQNFRSVEVQEYHNIPNNEELYYDLLVHNIDLVSQDYNKGDSAGVLYKEVLKENKIHFEPYIEESGSLSHKLGHEVLDCKNASDLEILKKRREVYALFV